LPRLASYLIGDFAGNLFFIGSVGVAPMLVMRYAGPADTARYYLAWTISYSLYLVSKGMGISLVAEGAIQGQRLGRLAAHALTHTVVLLVASVAAIVIGAPLILHLFGSSYAESGGAMLRVLALSALPFTVTSVYLSMARVEGKMIRVVVAQAVLACLVLALAVPLLDRLGAIGMAWAWLAAQLIIAGFLASGLSRRLARAHGR
jgi:O-antigen/teichoic acid export membrane protein